MSGVDEDRLPTGTLAEAWTFQQIGAFIFWFSQVEWELRRQLAYALDLPTGLIDPVAASYDFSKLCAVTLAAWQFHSTDATEFEKLIKRCRKVNDDRVRIVHGTWFPGEDALLARQMTREKLQTGTYFDTPGKLIQAVDECQKLADELACFPIFGLVVGQAIRAQRLEEDF